MSAVLHQGFDLIQRHIRIVTGGRLKLLDYELSDYLSLHVIYGISTRASHQHVLAAHKPFLVLCRYHWHPDRFTPDFSK